MLFTHVWRSYYLCLWIMLIGILLWYVHTHTNKILSVSDRFHQSLDGLHVSKCLCTTDFHLFQLAFPLFFIIFILMKNSLDSLILKYVIIIIIITSLSPLFRVAIHIFLRQTMSLGDTLFSYSLFVVYAASMSSSCVGSVVLLR